jgi:predicted DNA-binding transcriptional regulator YafY
MRRQARLFAIAEHLRSRRSGITAEALAERFHVSIRTIYRDLDTLRDAEMPVMADRGRGGGYALDRSYSLPPVNFSAREAAILVTAGKWLVDARLLPLVDTLSSALDKVRGALPSNARVELERFAASLAFVGVPARTAPPEVRSVIEQAWIERRPVQIRYHGALDITVRAVLIKTVVMERTETLLNCVDLDRNEDRQFRLHNISAASLVVDESSRPG